MFWLWFSFLFCVSFSLDFGFGFGFSWGFGFDFGYAYILAYFVYMASKFRIFKLTLFTLFNPISKKGKA